jgi:hypothetical protein
MLLTAQVAQRGDVRLVHGVTLEKPLAPREATLAGRLISPRSL